MLTATKSETTSSVSNGHDVAATGILSTIAPTIQSQYDFFKSGLTKDIDFRIEQLKKLKKTLHKYESEIYKALEADLHKCKFEAYVTEFGFIINEIDDAIKNAKKWAKPRKVSTALFHFKADSAVHSDPYGVVLVISPWNYPFQLLMAPLVGAIVAGNCVTLKPSEYSAATSAIMTKIVEETFDSHYVSIFEGAVDVSQELLKHKFDLVFFTGSTQVGKIVYQAAAKHLTPVVLELGGKSPCIVDKDTNLEITAKRILWGKFVNVGQTCIAPDYLMVHKDIKPALVAEMKKQIETFYGSNAEQSKDYGRIISDRHYNRLVELMQSGGTVVYGGKVRAEDRYISPTFIENVATDAPIMQEEIFGPLLPILEYDDLDEAIEFINNRPKPLALYVFSRKSSLSKKVLKETSSGGACVNDTVMHIGNPNLPFGGVGESGIGAYHGQSSFDVFSHQKSVMVKSFMVDPYIRYAPYKTSLSVMRFILNKFG